MKAIQRKAQGITAAVFTLVTMALAMVSVADTKSAHQVAEEVKDQMVAIIGDREKYEAQGEGKYYAAIVGLFEPVVDFTFIARGVMGDHAKTATEEQRQRFAEVLKGSLMGTVATYTQGLGGANQYSIAVVPPKEGDAEKTSVNVGLEVTTGESVNRLAFTMRLDKDEQWKIANMTLNGINLGITFRAQFAQAVKKAEGNLDAAIASWSA
jgi:phospholipid transport system substrate-binding protein